MRFTFFPEGRVDAYIIEQDKHYATVDAGYRKNGIDVVEKLDSMQVDKIDCAIVTHGHKNHCGGVARIIHKKNPGVVYIPHDGVRKAIIKFAASGAERRAAEDANYVILKPDDPFMLGSALFMCVGPLKIRKLLTYTLGENYNSLVILGITPGKQKVLLTGDTSSSILSSIYKKYLDTMYSLNGIALLKNPHHNGALPKVLLEDLSPIVNVVCNSTPPSRSYRLLLSALAIRLRVAGYRSKGGNGTVREEIT